MRPTFKHFIAGTLIGATITYILVMIAITNSYGRMSDHLHCNYSISNER